MSAHPGFPVTGYWISFNPKAHQGEVWLNMDNDAQPELHQQNLPAQDIAAMAAILNSGRARLRPDGALIMGS
jgi:hypothetical protein